MGSGLQTGTHADLGDVRFTVHPMPSNPDAQVAQTIAVMWGKVKEDAADPEFQAWARSIGQPGSAGGQVATCQRIWAHTKNNLQFKLDDHVGAHIVPAVGASIKGDDIVEVIVRPVDMMNYVQQGCGQGDCDDFSMYNAALMKACGVDCRFATVAANAIDPSQYTHVYSVGYPTQDNGEDYNPLRPMAHVRLPMDSSHGEFCGWEVPNEYGKFREWWENDAACEGGMNLMTLAAVGVMAFCVVKGMVR